MAVSFCFASDDIDQVRIAMAKYFNYNVSTQCVTGHVTIFKWSVIYSNLHMTLPIIPVYIAILVLRRLIIKKLHSDTAISEKTRHLHGQLLRALTLQALLPLFFVAAISTYAIGQLEIFHHPALEYSTFILLDGFPMLSPVINLYFVHPYHVWVRDKLLCRCRAHGRTHAEANTVYTAA
ncbi:hypothetical protein TELCIR_18630 [Teladorsagia circumcincta]|uniref:G-protein coupled receptors family 1 profile domain-containing protein n=1 Tax=Teladorsagia circumcincta TaxID=45464 RepID=A0A2G9TPF7_TELCI|nr:hypothetical protein TELCIR_18630 [Teladorsagia circumcincta]